MFLTSDLGLAVGALFPFMLYTASGASLPKQAPELIPSAVSLCIELVVMLWVSSVFPSRLVGLPEGVRFIDAKGRRRRKLEESDRSCGSRKSFRYGYIYIYLCILSMYIIT